MKIITDHERILLLKNLLEDPEDQISLEILRIANDLESKEEEEGIS